MRFTQSRSRFSVVGFAIVLLAVVLLSNTDWLSAHVVPAVKPAKHGLKTRASVNQPCYGTILFENCNDDNTFAIVPIADSGHYTFRAGRWNPWTWNSYTEDWEAMCFYRLPNSNWVSCDVQDTITVPVNPQPYEWVEVPVAFPLNGQEGDGLLEIYMEKLYGWDYSSTDLNVAVVGRDAIDIGPESTVVQVQPNAGDNQNLHLYNPRFATLTYDLSISCTGTVTSCQLPFTSKTLGPSSGGEYYNPGVSYNAGSTGGKVYVTASVTAGDSTFYKKAVYDVRTLTYGVSVTPDASTVQFNPHIIATQNFTVNNTGNQSAVFDVSVSCSGQISNCSWPSSISVSANSSGTVPVKFTTQRPGDVGNISITASSPQVSDQGSVTVSTVFPGGSTNYPVVYLSPYNPGARFERDLCLTVSLKGDAAYECGDLRITHPLPTIRTMNKVRTPTLIYNSQYGRPYPLVAASVSLRPQAGVPDSVTAKLFIGGVVYATNKWPGTNWSPGQTRRVVIGFDGATIPTGVYEYTLHTTNWYGSNSYIDGTSDTLIVVNRRSSPFGSGWWLAGLEKLHFVLSDRILWVGGDGSARLYIPAGTDKWAAPALSEPDTIKYESGYYVRYLPHGVKVKFNSSGEHVETINRLGHTTSFSYSSGVLQSVTLPPGISNSTYQFSYSGGRLQSVTNQGRTTTLTNSGGDVTVITDPDNTTVQFGYQGSLSLMRSATNRLGVTTSYTYDWGSRLAEVALDMGAAPDIVTNFEALEAKGVLSSQIVDESNAYTLVNGPRTDVNDHTKFWLTKYGAPSKVINALGDSTVLTCADYNWPALVTSMRAPNGYTVNAAYDSRGNLSTSTAVNPFGTGQNATTSYSWNSTFDFVTSITPPVGPTTTITYDANGNRTSQQTGSTSAINFYYTSNGQLRASQMGSARDSVLYDSNGNVVGTRTPLGFWTTYTRDSLGRVTQVNSAINGTDTNYPTSSSGRYLVETTYDVSDQVIQTASSAAGVATIYVKNDYNAEGSLTKVRRWQNPDSSDIDTLVTRWDFDNAGRQTVAYDVSGNVDSSIYDPAGNIVRTHTRRGHNINMQYDALNRITRRITDSAFYADEATSVSPPHTYFQKPFPFFPNSGTGYLIPIDTAVFAYDLNGNMIQADNRYAKIRRSYKPAGNLWTDTIQVRTWSGTDFSQHVYGITHEYDVAGRQASLYYPSIFRPSSSAYSAFGYDNNGTGGLASVTDQIGNTVSYQYDSQGRLGSLTLPAGIKQNYTYDLDDRIQTEVINQVPTSVSPSKNFLNSSTARNATFTRDARGKILTMFNSAYITDTLGSVYDAHGYLKVAASWQRHRDSDGSMLAASNVDTMAYDGLGNILHSNNVAEISYHGGGGVHTPGEWNDKNYQSGTGRMTSSLGLAHGRHLFYEYDVAGNTNIVNGIIQAGASDREATHHFYGADGKLAAVDYRYVGDSTLYQSSNPIYTGYISSDSTADRVTFTEYRYDALGRRITFAERHEDYCFAEAFISGYPQSYPCPDTVRTWSQKQLTVWDGSQVLADQKLLGISDESQGYGYLGVIYTHGLGIDRPVSVMKLDAPVAGGGQLWGSPIAVYPHWDYRGLATQGSFANGSSEICQTSTKCVRVEWVHGMGAYRYHHSLGTDFFWGDLINGGAGSASGLQYMRNRYYDPNAGRFTQEDPIGLAGGINAYGFAGSDPVNYSDPFGLCWWDLCVAEGTTISVGTAAAATALAGATAFVVSKADEIGDVLGSFADAASDAFDNAISYFKKKIEVKDNRKPHRTGGRESTRQKHENTRNPSNDKKRQNPNWKQNPNKSIIMPMDTTSFSSMFQRVY